MHFVAEKSWEIDSEIFKIFGGPETRRFPAMELSLNLPVLLVDIAVEDEFGDSLTRRFFFTETDNALNFVNQQGVVGGSIALLSRRCDNEGDYSVSDVMEIYEATGEHGQPVHIYHCADGKKYFGPFFSGSEDELNSLTCVYSKEREAG